MIPSWGLIMDFVGIAGLLVGIFGSVFGVWQWCRAKRQGDLLTTFLIGLKAADLPLAAIPQINDMIARLK